MAELFRDLHANSTTDLDGILSGKVAMEESVIEEAIKTKKLIETISSEQELVDKLKPLSEVDIFSFMKNLRGGTFFNMGMFTSIPVAKAHKKTYRIYKVVNMTAIVSGVSYENVGTTRTFRDQTGKASGKAFYDHVPGYENKVGVGKNNPNNKYILWDVKESSGNWVAFYLVDIATGSTHTISRDALLASPYLTNTEKDKLTPKPVTGFDLNTGALVTNETVWRTAKFEHVFWLSQQGANTQEYGAKFAESLITEAGTKHAGKGELFRDLHADSKTDLDGILSGKVEEKLTEEVKGPKVVFIDVTGSAAFTADLEAAATADGNKDNWQYTSDSMFADVLEAAEQGCDVYFYTADDDHVGNCPELSKMANVTIKTITKEIKTESKKRVKESVKTKKSNLKESYRRIITVDHSLVDNDLFVDFE